MYSTPKPIINTTPVSARYNHNYILWNAGLGYKFLKNNTAELPFTVFDILGQNNSVSRTFTDVYNEDTPNVLQRYSFAHPKEK
ncbi:MAG: hypothetical protein H7282_13235 [Cytophagaceae bacterium]|nr:hypothetical protein [Cytophagaceae bacterium]